MARSAGAPSRIYVDEFDWSGRSNSAELSVDVNLADISVFNSAADEFVEGQSMSKLTINGFFDGVAGGYDAEMFGDIADGAQHCVGVYPGSQATYGSVGFEIIGMIAGQPRPIEVSGAVLLHCTWQASGPVVRAKVLTNSAVTGTGVITTSKQNLGATGAGTTFVAILRVLAVSGSGSITVKVQHSSDNGGADPYADLISFAAKTAIGFQRSTVATATKAWKCVNVSAFSGFSSVTILVVCGYEQGTYVAP